MANDNRKEMHHGLWDQLKSRLTDMQSQATTQVGKFKSKDFAKASMAMCALIAAADGSITADERRKTAGFIGSNEALKVFEVSELQDHFTFYASKLESDYEFGKVEAIATIGKLKVKPDAARRRPPGGHHHRWRRRQFRQRREARCARGLQRGGHQPWISTCSAGSRPASDNPMAGGGQPKQAFRGRRFYRCPVVAGSRSAKVRPLEIAPIAVIVTLTAAAAAHLGHDLRVVPPGPGQFVAGQLLVVVWSTSRQNAFSIWESLPGERVHGEHDRVTAGESRVRSTITDSSSPSPAAVSCRRCAVQSVAAAQLLKTDGVDEVVAAVEQQREASRAIDWEREPRKAALLHRPSPDHADHRQAAAATLGERHL